MKTNQLVESALPIALKAIGQKTGVRVIYGPFHTASTDCDSYIKIPTLQNTPEARAIGLGYGIHEAYHVRATEQGFKGSKGKLHAHLLNLLEDHRIEKLAMREYAGAKKLLQDLASHLAGDWTKAPQGKIATVMGAIYARLENMRFTEKFMKGRDAVMWQYLESAFPHPSAVVDRLDVLLAKADRLRSTQQASELAEDILMMLKDEQEKAQNRADQAQQSNSQEGDSGEDDDQQGQGQPEQSDEEDGDDDQQGQSQPDDSEDGDGDDQAKGDGKDSDDDSDEETGSAGDSDEESDEDEPDTQGKGDQEESDDQDEGESQQSGSEDQASDETGEQDSGSDDFQEESGGDGAGSDPEEDEAIAEQLKQMLEDESALDDIDNPRERLQEELEKHEDPYSGLYPSQEQSFDVAPGTTGSQREREAQKASSQMARRMKTLLESMAREDRRPSYAARRLNTRKLANIKHGDTRVFEKRVQGAAVNTAVQILLDRSGSMHGSAINIAASATLAAALAVEANKGCVTQVHGYPGTTDNHVLQLTPFSKRVKDTLPKYAYVGTDGSTPMGQAMVFGVGELAVREEERKILLVLTDGGPNDHRSVTEAMQIARKHGIEVIGIGIGQELDHLFENSKRINRVEDLPRAMFSVLEDALRQKKSFAA